MKKDTHFDVVFPIVPLHFSSHFVLMACLQNSFESDIDKHISCFVEIHFG